MTAPTAQTAPAQTAPALRLLSTPACPGCASRRWRVMGFVESGPYLLGVCGACYVLLVRGGKKCAPVVAQLVAFVSDRLARAASAARARVPARVPLATTPAEFAIKPAPPPAYSPGARSAGVVTSGAGRFLRLSLEPAETEDTAEEAYDAA